MAQEGRCMFEWVGRAGVHSVVNMKPRPPEEDLEADERYAAQCIEVEQMNLPERQINSALPSDPPCHAQPGERHLMHPRNVTWSESQSQKA